MIRGCPLLRLVPRTTDGPARVLARPAAACGRTACRRPPMAPRYPAADPGWPRRCRRPPEGRPLRSPAASPTAPPGDRPRRSPGSWACRGRDPLARMAAHLEDAKLGPTGAGRGRRRVRGSRPGWSWRRGRRRVCGTAGHQEDSSSDGAEHSNGWRPQAASVSSADRHVMVLVQRWAALTVLRAKTKAKPWPLPCEIKNGSLTTAGLWRFAR
jgi:hypothetical protein